MENEHELSYETLTRVYLGEYEHYKSVAAGLEPLEPRFELDDQEWVEIETFSFDLLGSSLSKGLLLLSKFLGTVRFGNDHISRIMGYGDYQMGNVTISRVYYFEGLGHNFFSVGQFCDADLKVALRKNTCFIRNLEGVDLISGSRDTNLYTISLDDMLKTSPICLLLKASKTKSWLWHRRLSYLNFACALGKSNKSSHQPKAKDTNQEKLYLLHMDLFGPMRVASINGKMYILVIVEDYSRFTWVRFLRSKDEAPEAIIKCIKNIQNGIVERRNRTLVEVARTMLIFSKALLFLWVEAINTACYIQNRSLIRIRYNKTPYELMQDKKPNLSFFHVFGALCNPTNYNDDLCKLDAKGDIGIFVGYAHAKKAFRIYNKRTRKIIETIHVTFDELIAIASEHFILGLGLQCMNPATSSSGLVLNNVSQQPCIPQNKDDWDHLFQPMFNKYFNPLTFDVSPVPVVDAPRVVDLADSLVLMSIDQDAPSTSIPSTQEQEYSPNISQGLGLQCMTPATSSSGLVLNNVSQQPCIPQNKNDWDHLFQPMFNKYFNPLTFDVSPVPVVDAPRVVDLADSLVLMSIDQDAPSTSIPSTQEQEYSPNISQGFEESPKTPTFHDDPLYESLHEDSTF
nr:hypothetical protein [Tanacetum cinerariifolium]